TFRSKAAREPKAESQSREPKAESLHDSMFSPILLSAHNPGPMTGRGNNTYLIAAANGPAALIDAGTGERRHLEELGAALAPARLLPAHGPIVTDPHVVLTAYLDHRRMREGQVIEALRAGRSDVPAIAESIYDDLDPALMPAAHQNVRAHLDKLKADGLATDTGG